MKAIRNKRDISNVKALRKLILDSRLFKADIILTSLLVLCQQIIVTYLAHVKTEGKYRFMKKGLLDSQEKV